MAETPALTPFLPSICRFLLNEELRVPNLATWWCGQEQELSYVLDHLDELVIRPAWQVEATAAKEPALMSKTERDELVQQLKARPSDFVAQERMTRSTVPVWDGNEAQPWHAAYRLFVSSDGISTQTLPGGLARVSPDRYSLDRSMTAGERAQDVWVESEGPVERVSLLRPPDVPLKLLRSGNDLPSRDADNLFWLGRSIERVDGAARVFRVLLQRVTAGNEAAVSDQRVILRALVALGQIDPSLAIEELGQAWADIEHSLLPIVLSPQESRSLRNCTREIGRLVNTVRDRLSIDAWRSLHVLNEEWEEADAQGCRFDASNLLLLVDRMIHSLSEFGGLSSEGMTRAQVWRFLDLGRRLERVWTVATLLQTALSYPAENEEPILESLLESTDSLMTYRSRYLATMQAAAVIDLLLIDESNPRSIVFQLEMIQNHVARLPFAGQATLGPDERLAISMYNDVRLAEAQVLANSDSGFRQELDSMVQSLIDQIPLFSNAISQRYLIHAGLARQFGGE